MLLTNSEKKDNNRLEFTVVSDAKEFDDAVTKAYLKEKKQINIPGFRKGKAPLAVIEGMYGPEVFYQGALDELAQPAFEAGIDQGKVNMIGLPAITAADVTEDRCATFTFSVELYPEVELGQYKGLEVTETPVEVTDEEVDAEIENKRKQNARMISADDRAAQMGDTCNIDFDGFLDKEKTDRFDGGKSEGFDLELGSGSFVPGFEDQIVGMKVGEEKDIDITFPTDYVEDLAGKDVVFNVKLNAIKAAELPALDDEFAKDVSEFDTLAEYKDSVKKELTERKETQNKANMRSEAISKAIENMKADVPETMIKSHIDAIIRNFAANYGLSDPSIPTERIAAMLGIDENTMNTAIRPSAVVEAQTELLVNAVIEAEKIEGTEEEINEYINKLAGTVGATVDDIKNYFGMDYIASEYKKEAAMSLIADSAIAVKATKKKATKTTKAKAEKAEAEEKAPKATKTTKTTKSTKSTKAAKEETEEVKEPKKRTSKKKEVEDK